MAEGTQLPPQLLRYWTVGPGAAKIRWGDPSGEGDFQRCILNIQAEVTDKGGKPLPDRVIKGLCATLHKVATGATPGHAATEQHG